MPEGVAVRQPETAIAAAPRDYVGIARQYARDVVSGDIVACKWIKLQAQRTLDDWQAWEGDAPDYPYTFDAFRAALVCEFVEGLPHIKGRWKTANIVLEPWQIWGLVNVFGWLRKEDGLRRYSYVYECVARKNAKSTKIAGVGLYMLLADGEPGAEVYSAATKKEQAKIVFGVAHAMTEKCTDMRRAFGAITRAAGIFVPSEFASFVPLDAKPDTQDGHNIHAILCDEKHAWKGSRGREMHDVLETAMGSRTQPLFWDITTAGSDMASVCYETQVAAQRVLEGKEDDPSLFAMIYTLDEDDDWADPDVWVKANPNLGVSVRRDEINKLFQRALVLPSRRNGFKTKRLNLWVGAATEWLDYEAWKRGGNDQLRLEDFEGRDCFIGLDLSSKLDLTVKTYLFPDDDRENVTIFARFYLPWQTIKKGENALYEGWQETGFIHATDGAMVDYDRIEAELVGCTPEGMEHELSLHASLYADVVPDVERFNVLEVDYDPWNATQLVKRCTRTIADRGLQTKMVEIRPTVQNYSEAMKEWEARVASGNVAHDDNPVTNWCVSNVVAFEDVKGNIFPRKDRATKKKIDAAIGIIATFNRWMVHRQKTPAPFELVVV